MWSFTLTPRSGKKAFGASYIRRLNASLNDNVVAAEFKAFIGVGSGMGVCVVGTGENDGDGDGACANISAAIMTMNPMFAVSRPGPSAARHANFAAPFAKIGAASGLLAGCGGSQPPIGAPGAMPLAARSRRPPSAADRYV